MKREAPVREAPGREGQRRDERGVAVVEFSFVAIMLLAIVAATVDLGLGWQSGLVVNEAARTGARVGSGLADEPGTDYFALTGVKANLATAGKIDNVEKVVVFKAASSDGKVPSTCLSASPSGDCNVLTGDQFRALDKVSFNLTWPGPGNESDPPTGSGCLRSGAALSRSWCPDDRDRRVTMNEYYGVYIEYRHDNLFPVSGDSRIVKRTAVMRLEPPPL